MYEISFYLNQIPDGHITMRVDDVGMLKASLYDADGEAFVNDPGYSAYTAVLIVRRSDSNATNEITITPETDGDADDNYFYFSLEDINYEPGNYEAHVVLLYSGEDMDATPIGPTTPIDLVVSFELFTIEVLT